MRIVFVGIGSEQLGIELLSAALKREGHDVRLVYHPSLFDDRFALDVPSLARFFRDDDGVVERVARLEPDLIAFSVLSNTYQWCLKIAREARARAGAPVIFGGVHPSAVPEVVIKEDCVDAVCVGEGDRALPLYVRALAEGSEGPIPNLWRKLPDGALVKGPLVPFEQDLDALPFPDKSLYEDDFPISEMYATMTGRGCPYRCTFCFNNFWAKIPSRGGVSGGRYVRQRGAEKVLQELKEARRRWGIRYVAFHDDIFTVDKEWLQGFLPRYRDEIGLPFFCLVHPNFVDEDIVRWLKDAGCDWVQMGIQSVDEHYKHATLKRYEKGGDVASAMDALVRAGIKVKGDHILGSPGEPANAQEAARLFYSAHTPAGISTFWMTYLPGVEITTEAARQGVLTPRDLEDIDNGLYRSYHSRSAGLPPRAGRDLTNYEALFHTLPLLPRRLRGSLKASAFERVPRPVLGSYIVAVDLLVALVQRNPEFRHFGRYMLAQLWKSRRLPVKTALAL